MLTQPRLLTVGLCLLGALVALPAAADDIFPYKVHQTTLDNGLKVVVIPYDSPGTVAYYVIARTGSRDEVEPGHSGFAHFFEHMMFRGTERHSSDEYNDVIKRMGADTNAYTNDDRTVYHMVGPAAELEVMMDIESDRFKNLDYDEEDFRREALAVLGEYNKNISNPFLPLYERMRELAFQEHTYSHTTMGFLADIKAMPDYYDYSLSFFNRFYRPENIVVLVVGDVDPAKAFAMAKKYYGDWERGYQSPKIAAEPAQTETKEGHIDWAAPIRPHMMAGYRVPAFSAETVDTAALDLIGQLLFSESARLYQQLVVDEQWVDFVSGSYNDHRDPYLFMIYSRVKSEDLMDDVQAAIDKAIADLQKNPVDPEKLERIKSHLRYSFALSLDSPNAISGTVTNYLSLTGDPLTVNEVYAQYQKVTPADIQRVAKEVFKPTNYTVVTLSYTEPAADGEAEATAEGR
ncbi:MAG: pitrilysin family protein [Thermoanaerobaculia bacterium]